MTDTGAVQLADPVKIGSLWGLAGLLALGCVLGYLWVMLVLPPYNSEHLGPDACHHAIMIHALSLPNQQEGAFTAGHFATYPHLSHRIAASLLFAVNNDAFRAMRLVSVISLLGLLAVQYHLFRRVFSGRAGVLALVTWQALGSMTRTADMEFFRGPYFFAQGVGELFAWLAIALVSWPARTRWGRAGQTGVAIGLAVAAYLCHLVPGLVALGGLGLVLLMRLRLRPWWPTVVALGVLALAGLAAIFGTEQFAHMAACKQADGDTPFRYLPLVLLWIPTAVLAVAVAVRRFKHPLTTPGQELTAVLTMFLLTAALLDGYAAFEWAVRNAVAPYAVKKFFFFLFADATMLWLVWLRPVLVRAARRWESLAVVRGPSGWRLTRLARANWGLATLILLGFSVGPFIANELKGPVTPSDQTPESVAAQLYEGLPPFREDEPGSWRSRAIYFDPKLPQSSVYVNIVGLRRSFAEAYQVLNTLAQVPDKETPEALHRLRGQVSFTRVISPG
jgi:hypothetical protein